MSETSLQYPVGHFTAPDVVSTALRAAAIDEITGLPAAMRAAVQGLSLAQLETPYRDGGWTVRQVVHHVPDSHMHAYTRVKFALTEESPTIRPYDEGAWSLLPDVVALPIDVSLTLLDAIHLRWSTWSSVRSGLTCRCSVTRGMDAIMSRTSRRCAPGWDGEHRIGNTPRRHERRRRDGADPVLRRRVWLL